MSEHGNSRQADPILLRQVEKLTKINAVLMDRVERSMDQQGSAYSLFQTAIALEAKVRSRTEELTAALNSLERANDALSVAKEEAERANLSKTRFLAAASHDLLQPLNAAKLSISVLGDILVNGEARTLANRVERSLKTIEDLIKTLLDISKLDAGVVQPEFGVVSLSDMLATLAGSFEPMAVAKGLRLTVRPSRLLVRSDPMLLGRVLQNLISNALRYTQTGGVLIGARRRGDEAWIEVTDTGCGITDAECDRIFDEFYRGAASARDDQGGLGLGLAIVRRTVQALGARLALNSRVGRGSTFRVIVPCLATTPAHTGSMADEDTWQAAIDTLAGRSVLVVDNDQRVLEAMASLLQRWTCRVETIRSMSEIKVGMLAPDIVIADYHLDDGHTGLDVIAALREAALELPAVIVTADYTSKTAEHVRHAGCEMLHKPVKPAELRAVMTHLLNKVRK